MDLCGFRGFLGPGVGRCVAGCGSILGPGLDPIVSLQDQILRSLITSMTDDSMILCTEPGRLESGRRAARMVIFIEFHGI